MSQPKPVVSIWMWVMFTLVYVLYFLVGLVSTAIRWPFDPHRETMNWFFMMGGRTLPFWNPGLKLRFEGLDASIAGKPVIFVANHSSFLDMPVLANLPWRMKWLSKDGLTKIPGVGTMMRLGGHVAIKRGTTGAAKALERLKPYVEAGVPVMIFPEGTRSVTGQMTAFKNGAFLLSRETGAPIQPLVIQGTHEALPPGTWKFQSPGRLTVSVLQPFHPNDYETLDAFRDAVYQAMKSEYSRLADTKAS